MQIKYVFASNFTLFGFGPEETLELEYKEGGIGFPYTLLRRFWTAEELVSA